MSPGKGEGRGLGENGCPQGPLVSSLGSLHCRPGCQKWSKPEADLAEPQGKDLDHGGWRWCLSRVQVTEGAAEGMPVSFTQGPHMRALDQAASPLGVSSFLL